jgi:hypothetical protein
LSVPAFAAIVVVLTAAWLGVVAMLSSLRTQRAASDAQSAARAESA